MKRYPATLVPVIEIHHTDLEAIIKRAYGFRVSVEMAAKQPREIGIGYRVEELGYYVDGTLLASNPAWKDRAAAVRSGHRTGDIHLLLNVLAVDGFIHRGRWIVRTGPKPKHRVADNQKWDGSLVDLRVAIGRM